MKRISPSFSPRGGVAGNAAAMRSAALCKQHTFALLWLVLVLCSAVRPPPPPALDLDGACAGVKSSDSWKDAKTGSAHWSYRIKVQPWTVFGRVHVELHGYNMKVVEIYNGDVDEKAKSFWVSLHPEHSAGPDSTFQIEGEGEAYAEPTLTCEGLHEVIRFRYAHWLPDTRTRTPPVLHHAALPPDPHRRRLVCQCGPLRGHEWALRGALTLSDHLT